MNVDGSTDIQYRLHTLANGLRIIWIPMAALRSASLVLCVGVGSRHEIERLAGASHLVEHLLFRGTTTRPRARAISEPMDAVGGILNAGTDKELTTLWVKVASEHVSTAVELLADMVQHSLFRRADLVREKGVIVEELAMLSDDPQDWLWVLTDELLWPGQPLGREIAGTRSNVQRMRRHDVLDHVAAYYGPDNAVLAVAGGVRESDVLDLARRHFGDWQPVHPPPPPTARFGEAASYRVETRPTEQVNLSISFPGVARGHSDRPAIEALCTILGNGTSSRLWARLRDRLAAVYDVQMSAGYYNDVGLISISVGMEPSRLGMVLEAIQRELERVAARAVPAAELQKAKQFYRGRMWLGMEDPQSVASWFAAHEILQHEIVTPGAVLREFEAVTVADIRRVARTYLGPAMQRIVAVGPLTGDQLEQHAGGQVRTHAPGTGA